MVGWEADQRGQYNKIMFFNIRSKRGIQRHLNRIQASTNIMSGKLWFKPKPKWNKHIFSSDYDDFSLILFHWSEEDGTRPNRGKENWRSSQLGDWIYLVLLSAPSGILVGLPEPAKWQPLIELLVLSLTHTYALSSVFCGRFSISIRFLATWFSFVIIYFIPSSRSSVDLAC